MNKDFKYKNAAETAKPGYLVKKWNQQFPGWNRPKKPAPVVELKVRRAG